MGQEFLPEKNQNNAAGHRRHDASTTTGSVRLWFIQNVMIDMQSGMLPWLLCM